MTIDQILSDLVTAQFNQLDRYKTIEQAKQAIRQMVDEVIGEYIKAFPYEEPEYPSNAQNYLIDEQRQRADNLFSTLVASDKAEGEE